MDGLTEGRMVHYVTIKGDHRPAIIVKVWSKETGCSNLQVFTDGYNDCQDRGEFEIPQNVVWITSVSYSEKPKPGRWHFPEQV
jgi:hypothetical protein